MHPQPTPEPFPPLMRPPDGSTCRLSLGLTNGGAAEWAHALVLKFRFKLELALELEPCCLMGCASRLLPLRSCDRWQGLLDFCEVMKLLPNTNPTGWLG